MSKFGRTQIVGEVGDPAAAIRDARVALDIARVRVATDLVNSETRHDLAFR